MAKQFKNLQEKTCEYKPNFQTMKIMTLIWPISTLTK